jgi:hypothetical protein
MRRNATSNESKNDGGLQSPSVRMRSARCLLISVVSASRATTKRYKILAVQLYSKTKDFDVGCQGCENWTQLLVGHTQRTLEDKRLPL